MLIPPRICVVRRKEAVPVTWNRHSSSHVQELDLSGFQFVHQNSAPGNRMAAVASVNVCCSAGAVSPPGCSPGTSNWRTQVCASVIRVSVPRRPTSKGFFGPQVAASSFRHGVRLDRATQNGSRWNALWQDNSAVVEVDVPLEVAWDLWEDREGVNRWMPWIHSIKIQEDKPELSKWTLKYEAFGQKLEFSWLARNLKPIFHQKIHWRSVDGLSNRGAVRFYRRSPSSCGVQLTISYEVPQVLSGVSSALAPLVESILQADMERFAKFARQYTLEKQPK
ncbi:hypothetical protein R1flu_014892 [Riccia fluitans]|uniref:Coenzyme Q-binding protein COQ10 START domain-containing protein n=1 Tax=Riccia fluitans TaxID=41844 RepID=A0ABD1YHD8_9MARC